MSKLILMCTILISGAFSSASQAANNADKIPDRVGAYAINALPVFKGDKLSSGSGSASIVYMEGRNSVRFSCDPDSHWFEFSVDEMIAHQENVTAYFHFPDGAQLKTDGFAKEGFGIGENRSTYGDLYPAPRIIEKMISQSSMKVTLEGYRSIEFTQSLRGAGEAIRIANQWCRGELE